MMHRFRYAIIAGTLLLAVGCGTPTPSQTTETFGFEDGATTQPAAEAPTVAEPVAETEATAAMLPTEASEPASGGQEKTGRKSYSAAPAMAIDPSKQYRATIETTKGTIQAELYPGDAPLTVNNFVVLARDDFYDGIKFHRIVANFMVQTGDPQGDGTGGPGYSFEDEPVTRDYERGTLAMANSGPNTNGSQFFIVHADAGLPKSYTIFGKVTEGLDVLDAIAAVPVSLNQMSGEESLPQEEVLITGITIQEQ